MKAMAIIDMPESCEKCPFLELHRDMGATRYKCYLEKELWKFLDKEQIGYKRNENCPLTEYKENKT